MILFERFEKCQKEGLPNTTKVESPREEIKEEDAEQEEEGESKTTGGKDQQKHIERTSEVTIRFDIDNEK